MLKLLRLVPTTTESAGERERERERESLQIHYKIV